MYRNIDCISIDTEGGEGINGHVKFYRLLVQARSKENCTQK